VEERLPLDPQVLADLLDRDPRALQDQRGVHLERLLQVEHPADRGVRVRPGERLAGRARLELPLVVRRIVEV